MMPRTHTTANNIRLWALAVTVTGLFALVGCKHNNKDGTAGANVSRGKNDPLLATGGSLIPKQNVPVPDRATKGTKGDPLTTPTGSGGKAGYNDDPERFKGTFIPGKTSTPAALTNRVKDGEELKIADTGGVMLKPAGGTIPSNAIEPPADAEPLLKQLERYGVSRGDQWLERDGGTYTFRASVPLKETGGRRQYTGTGPTAYDAIKQVADQLKSEK